MREKENEEKIKYRDIIKKDWRRRISRAALVKKDTREKHLVLC